jgi:hypothetical protein
VDYSRQSVAALFRGPLVSTPQGWVVVASAVAYAALALAFAFFGLGPPLGKGVAAAVTLCLLWPFVVFLLFVKHGLPSFAPSWSNAVFIAVCAAAPVLYFVWRSYA